MTMKAHQMLKMYLRNGWYIKRQTGHYIMAHNLYNGAIPIPRHKKELKKKEEVNLLKAFNQAKEKERIIQND